MLIEAIKNKDIKAIRRALKETAEINYKDEQGRTALWHAVFLDNRVAARILLDHGADIYIKNNSGEDLLAVAPSISMVKLLIEKGFVHKLYSESLCDAIYERSLADVKVHLALGADVNELDGADGGRALHYATMEDYLVPDIVKFLIKAGARVNVKEWQYQDTPLHYIAMWGDEELAQLLLDAGARLDSVNIYGETPLHKAARYGSAELIELFLSHKANLFTVDADGNSVLYKAAQANGDRVELISLLLKKGLSPAQENKFGKVPLHAAIAAGNKEVTKLLLQQGADSDWETKDGWTALQVAVQEGKLEEIRILLEHGVDVNRVNKKNNQTAVFLIAYQSLDVELDTNAQILEVLLAAGANINHIDGEKNSPLDRAVAKKDTQAIKLLSTHGATAHNSSTMQELFELAVGNLELMAYVDFTRVDLNKRDITGATLLHRAEIQEQPALVEILVKHGANVNLVHYSYTDREKGYMPIHRAARDSRYEVTRLLLEYGADVNAIDIVGNTPLHYSLYYKNFKIAQLLLSYGAQTMLVNKRGHTPLFIAQESEDEDMINLLKYPVF